MRCYEHMRFINEIREFLVPINQQCLDPSFPIRLYVGQYIWPPKFLVLAISVYFLSELSVVPFFSLVTSVTLIEPFYSCFPNNQTKHISRTA